MTTPNQPESTNPTGQEPKASPGVRVLAILFGLLLIAAAFVAGRELWLKNSDSTNWPSWLDPVFNFIDNIAFEQWMGWVGIAVVVVGLYLVIMALKPRPRTHHRINAKAAVWTRPVDIARFVTSNARRVPGVTTASTSVTKKKARLSVNTADDDPQLAADLKGSIGEKLDDLLAEPPVLNVAARKVEDSSSEVNS